MATIRVRKGSDGKAAYHVQVRLRGSVPESATFDSKTAAKHWAGQIEAAIRENRHFRTSEARRRSVAELIDRYIKDWLPQKPKSEATQQGQLLWWREELGSYKLSALRPELFLDARSKLAKRQTRKKTSVSPSTINRYIAALSAVFKVAVRELGWIHENPLGRLSKLKEPKGRTRYLTPEELEELITQCKASPNPYLLPFVKIALSTGMRRDEILGLKWSDVDLLKKLFLLEETKNGERRLIPITLPVCSEISQIKKYQAKWAKKNKRETPVFVFPSKNGEQPLDIRAPWERAIEAAEISDFRIHDLRHTAASYLAMGGAGPLDIANILGHKSLEMTRRYTHLSPQHTAKVMESVGKKMLLGGDD